MCLDLLYSVLREKEIAKLRADAEAQRPKTQGNIQMIWVNIFSDGSFSGVFNNAFDADAAAKTHIAANQNVRLVDILRREISLAA